MTERQRNIYFLMGIFLVALAVRLAFVLALNRTTIFLDEVEYHMLGANVAAGNGYCWFFGLPATFRPPGYPFFLAVIYWFVGPSYSTILIIQCALGASISVLTYLFGTHVFNVRTARLAAIFTALYPSLVTQCGSLLTENLFMPLLVLAFWLLVRGGRETDIRQVILPALALALAILVRPSSTPLVPVICLWVFLRRKNVKNAIAQCAVIVGIWALVVSPWCIRNYYKTGQFVYLDTLTGFNLYIGYNRGANGTHAAHAAHDLARVHVREGYAPAFENLVPPDEISRLIRMEYDSYKLPGFPNNHPRVAANPGGMARDVVMSNWGKARAMESIKSNPLHALKLLPRKFMYFWDLEHHLFTYAYSQNALGPLSRPVLLTAIILMLAPFVLLTLAGVFGSVFRYGQDKGLFLIFSLIGYFTLLHTMTFGQARYHFILIPFIALLAASGLLNARNIVRTLRSPDGDERTRAWRRMLVAVAVCLVFVGTWTFGLHGAWHELTTIFGPNGNQTHLPF